MRNLFTSAFCANGCGDAKPVALDDEPTKPFRRLRLDGCPECGSFDIAPFELGGAQLKHCWSCGHVLR